MKSKNVTVAQRYAVRLSSSAERAYRALASDRSLAAEVGSLDDLFEGELRDNPANEKNRLAGHFDAIYRARTRGFSVCYLIVENRDDRHVLVLAISPICAGPSCYEIWTDILASGKHEEFLHLIGADGLMVPAAAQLPLPPPVQ